LTCQKEKLVLYTAKVDDEASWVEDIENACSKLRKNRATLKRESNQFEPLRKPDIIKMRRESLSKIMLMRRTEENLKDKMRKDTKTRSPIKTFFSPRKRKTDNLEESPSKLKKIVESPVKVEDFESTYDRAAASVLDVESSSNCTASTSVASPNSTSLTPMINELKMKQGKVGGASNATTPTRTTLSRKAKENMTPTRITPSRKAKAPPPPPKRSEKTVLSPSTSQNKPKSNVPKVKETKYATFRKQPRNSVKSLSLYRSKQKATLAPPKTIFSSPSIYDDDVTMPSGSGGGSDSLMSTFLGGKIVPLTPSKRPTNVEHLARKEDGGIVHQPQEEVDHPVAIPDTRSYCVIS